MSGAPSTHVFRWPTKLVTSFIIDGACPCVSVDPTDPQALEIGHRTTQCGSSRQARLAFQVLKPMMLELYTHARRYRVATRGKINDPMCSCSYSIDDHQWNYKVERETLYFESDIWYERSDLATAIATFRIMVKSLI